MDQPEFKVGDKVVAVDRMDGWTPGPDVVGEVIGSHIVRGERRYNVRWPTKHWYHSGRTIKLMEPASAEEFTLQVGDRIVYTGTHVHNTPSFIGKHGVVLDIDETDAVIRFDNEGQRRRTVVLANLSPEGALPPNKRDLQTTERIANPFIDNKETCTMRNAPKIESRLFITTDNGTTKAADLSDEQLLREISDCENEVTRLKGMTAQPKVVVERIAELEAGIAAIVAYMDERFDAKTK